MSPSSLSAQSASGVVTGQVVERGTGTPLADAAVLLPARGWGTATDADGRFRFEDVPPGLYEVYAQRLGYAPGRAQVRVRAGVVTVRLALDETPLDIPEIRVNAPREHDQAATLVLDGASLRRQLGGSVAATLTGQPGVWQRYNGPVAAQPVIRGLSGDRVLVLEDGLRTGDIATTAADHAVTVDPLTASRLEVVRGPAGLLFGSATLGGTVNIVRDDVPRALPDRPQLSVRAQGESVNRGGALGAMAKGHVGSLVLRAEALGRLAHDTRTPDGSLPYTDMDGQNVGAGLAWVGSRGHAGVALRDVRSTYGIPGSFQGRTIPGAHEGGIYIDLHRVTGRFEAQLRDVGPMDEVEADVGYSWFRQDEYERGGFVGTRFGQLLGTAQLVARHRTAAGGSGAIGGWGLWRDWAAAGSQTGTRPAEQWAGAAFGYHEHPIGRVRLQAGVRFDHTHLIPRDTTSSRISIDTRLTGIRARRFTALTGALGLVLDAGRGWQVGTSLARSFRPPAVEELYANGPHLASYAYEVGNPSLTAETGVGLDVYARHTSARLSVDAALFANRIAGYVSYAPLLDARTELPLRDYRLRRYDVYQATQTPALFVGAEGRLQWAFRPNWVAEATVQYVRGTDTDTDQALPFIPPLHGAARLRYEHPRVFAGIGLDAAANQERVPRPPGALAACLGQADTPGCPAALPGEFVPTDGRVLANAVAGTRFDLYRSVHTLTLRAENLLDRAWRDPLSRIKSVAPQPGLNLTLLYQIDL